MKEKRFLDVLGLRLTQQALRVLKERGIFVHSAVRLLDTELVTVPVKILEMWAGKNFPMPDKNFRYQAPGKPIPYEELDLHLPWEAFDIQHELTRKGIDKFVADYRATLSGRE